MAHRKITDEAVVATVARLQEQEGSVTLRPLAHELGLSVSGVQKRVEQLVAAGRLERGGITGALRPATLRGQRIEVPVILEVDRETLEPLAVRLA
jgi:DNA-binding Lrp family transcriptional regulator